jgi:hypothetical protein
MIAMYGIGPKHVLILLALLVVALLWYLLTRH